LAEMGAQLGQIERGFTEEAERVRAHVRRQREELRGLQATLAERIGPPESDEALATIDDRGGLTAMRAIEHDLATRIETIRGEIGRADSVAPSSAGSARRPTDGGPDDAEMDSRPVLAGSIEHRRTLDLLRRARAQAGGSGRQLAAHVARAFRRPPPVRDETPHPATGLAPLGGRGGRPRGHGPGRPRLAVSRRPLRPRAGVGWQP